jgi:hypothetical protein
MKEIDKEAYSKRNNDSYPTEEGFTTAEYTEATTLINGNASCDKHVFYPPILST